MSNKTQITYVGICFLYITNLAPITEKSLSTTLISSQLQEVTYRSHLISHHVNGSMQYT